VGAVAAQSEPSQTLVYGDTQRLTMGDRPSVGLLLAEAASAELLKVGSRGERVRELQALLQQLGYDVTLDGSFGEKTRLAVVDFQTKKGLPADGQVGNETFDLLEQGFTDTLTDLTGIPTGEPSPNLEPTLPGDSTVTPSLEATPSLDADASEALSPSAVPSPTVQASSSPSEPPINFRWVGLGMGVLLIFTALLGAIAYIIAQGGKIGASSSSAIKPSNRPWNTSPDSSSTPPDAAPDAASTAPQLEPATNGEGHNGSIANGYAKSANTSYTYTTISETDIPRLQKVDIGDELIKDLQSPDPTRRRKAIWDLGQHGDSRAVQPLVELMIDSDSSQRNLILAALSEIGMRTMKPMNRALMISLEDENSDVRKNAIRDVTRVYEQIAQITTILRHAIDDRDQDVQQTAHWALNQINRIRALPEADSGSNEPSYPTDPMRQDSSTPS
jgi:peptidoglycan hydrolase-like protein with peptidoglycan-binding domain